MNLHVIGSQITSLSMIWSQQIDLKAFKTLVHLISNYQISTKWPWLWSLIQKTKSQTLELGICLLICLPTVLNYQFIYQFACLFILLFLNYWFVLPLEQILMDLVIFIFTQKSNFHVNFKQIDDSNNSSSNNNNKEIWYSWCKNPSIRSQTLFIYKTCFFILKLEYSWSYMLC